MNLLQNNKSIPISVNLLKKQPNNARQTKKKTNIIKLEVNKLFKPESYQTTFHKNTKSQHVKSNHLHQKSQQLCNHHKSLQKQAESKPQKKLIKTFEELYFQKIKQLRLQQNNFTPSLKNGDGFAHKQNIRPNSCKNIVTIKQKNKPIVQQPQSTKNSQSEVNKENVFVQKIEGNTENPKNIKFFKKKDPKIIEELKINHHVLSQMEKVSQKTVNNEDKSINDQKGKRILKLKKKSKLLNKEQMLELQQDFSCKIKPFNPLDNVFDRRKHFDINQNLVQREENTIFSPMSSCMNPSLELKTFKLSTPSSSAQKTSQLSSTEMNFDQIIRTKINHMQHEHIWNGTECFFSFDEFKFVVEELGFEDNILNKEAMFYVKKLWEHLGGDLYGGIVGKNMRQFLNVVLEEDKDLNSQITEILTSKQELPLESTFIEKSSLRLVNLNQRTKDQIRKFYFPFRISKIASEIHHLHIKQSVGSKLNNSVNSVDSLSAKNDNNITNSKNNQTKQGLLQSKDICLQNNAYLDTISVKNRNQDLSPCMIPRVYENSNDINFVTDFSPKMSAQKYEPFKSTVLIKHQFQNQKLSTEQQGDQQAQNRPLSKPLLSVDVNLGEGIMQKLLVYQDQNPYEISLQLKERYNIDEELRQKFQKMLRNHLNTLLFKIQEVSEELFEDSLQLRDQDNQPDFVLMKKE